MPFCGMCATSGYRMPACLEPLIAHIDALHPSSTIVRRIGRRPGVPHVGLLSNGAELKNQPKRELNLAGGAGGLVDDPEAGSPYDVHGKTKIDEIEKVEKLSA